MLYYLIFYGVDMLLWSAALVLTLAVIALVSGHRLSRAQKIWILILALYLAAVYNVAGAPELPYIYPNFNVNLIPFIDIRSDVPAYLINSGLNIILFMPLGFILPLLWRRFRSRKRIILTGFLNLFSIMQDAYSISGRRPRNPSMPVLFISGEDDPCLLSPRKFHQAVRTMQRAGYTDVRSRLYPSMRHEILNEKGKEAVWVDVLSFCKGLVD